MARRRSKAPAAVQPVIAPENDPTPQRQRVDRFEYIAAPRMVGEEVGLHKIVSTRRRADPLVRFEAGHDPWCDRGQGAALEKFALLHEQAGYDMGATSCLKLESTGGSYEGVTDQRTECRRRLARASNAIASVDQTALLFLNAVISPSRQATVGELSRSLLRGGLLEARSRIVTAADALSRHFGPV